jgi:CheY-like chemotaxis protein
MFRKRTDKPPAVSIASGQLLKQTKGGRGHRVVMVEKKQSRTVLVVEDVEEISLQMGAMLREKGHRVIFANDAEQAIRAAEKQPPALILTDFDLPAFDKLLSLMRQHDDLKHVDVAVIDIDRTAHGRNVKVLKNFQELDELLS